MHVSGQKGILALLLQPPSTGSGVNTKIGLWERKGSSTACPLLCSLSFSGRFLRQLLPGWSLHSSAKPS